MSAEFEGKVAVITGAAMGIGQTVALDLAKDGVDCALIDLDENLLKETQKSVEALGRKAICYKADISNWTRVSEVADDVIKQFGRVDILLNSAGILGPNVPIWEYSVEDFDLVMAVDLKGTFLMCKAFVGQMRKQQSGRIVNLSSIAGRDGNPMMAGYTTAKAGVIAFTRGLALEVVGDGIIVNSIAPAVIEGRISQATTPEQQKVLKAKIPMGRYGTPQEVANLVRFLCSDACTFSTGCCYDISGGRCVH